MPEYEFRLRFHLMEHDRIKSDDQILNFGSPVNHVRLVTWKTGTSIGDSPRLFLVGGPYPSVDAAEVDGMKARNALLLWALQRRLPIDLGDGQKRGGLTAHGQQHFAELLGGPVRDQVHGLDVYERLPGQKFMNFEATGAVGISPSMTLSSMTGWFASPLPLTQKQILSAELFCAAGFDVPVRSRFLTLMTSFEALLEHQPRAAAVDAIVIGLENKVRAAGLPRGECASLLGSLKWMHNESIGQAGRRVAAATLGSRTYDKLTPKSFFTRCYELRSQIVHTGVIADDLDLLDIANHLHQFVGDVLHASIGVPSF